MQRRVGCAQAFQYGYSGRFHENLQGQKKDRDSACVGIGATEKQGVHAKAPEKGRFGGLLFARIVGLGKQKVVLDRNNITPFLGHIRWAHTACQYLIRFV